MSSGVLKNLFYVFNLFLVFGSSTNSRAAESDLGVCFLKVQQETLQSKINQVAMTPEENAKIQKQVRYFNDIRNLFVRVDSYNYKLFWLRRPNLNWLRENCFKYGFITEMDYTRRAITRVYAGKGENPRVLSSFNNQGRMPSSYSSNSSPYITNPVQRIQQQYNPQAFQDQQQYVQPQYQQQYQGQQFSGRQPSQQEEASRYQRPNYAESTTAEQTQRADSESFQQRYAIPQITLNNYFTSSAPQVAGNNTPNETKKEEAKSQEQAPQMAPQVVSQQPNNQPTVIVLDNDSNQKQVAPEIIKEKAMSKPVNFEVEKYLSKASTYFELNPYMAYEFANAEGSGTRNELNVFNYGADFKLGYRFNQYFNLYSRFTYNQLEVRSTEAPTVVDAVSAVDMIYGLGVQHVASRFFSIALEYNFLQVNSFERTVPVFVLEPVRKDLQMINLNFRLNFVSRDTFKFGFAGNYGSTFSGNRDELNFNVKNSLYILKTFDNGQFGASIGYENLKFSETTGPIEEVNRNKYIFSLNYGFDL